MLMEGKSFYQNRTFKFLILIAILAVCFLMGRYFHIDYDYYRTLISKYPPVISGFIFISLYVGVTTFAWFGPKDVFRVVGAILFGPVMSTVCIWISEMANAAILFYLSRFFGRGFVQQKFRLKSKQLDNVKNESGISGIVALRINPLVPFRLMDLGYGLTQVGFAKYFFVILLASLPRIFWLQYILTHVGESLFKDVPAVITYLMENTFILKYSALYFLSVLVLTIMAVIVKYFKRRRERDDRKQLL
jgi:uncharacterized membrane protein YdjX (TVP38/TMEM64 family)